MEGLVELHDISKSYDKKTVLNKISMSIDRKRMIAILGGNGSGKSTLLRMIAGVERPDAGQVLYQKRNINVGYVPERFPKEIRFTPSEYLNYIGKIKGIHASLLKSRIAELLHLFQLQALDSKRIMNLSKGNIQKVGIIQAILQEPDLLILDEPLSGLDHHAQEALIQVILELKSKGTAIVVTYHESDSFEGIVDETYHIDKGMLSSSIRIQKELIKQLVVENLNKNVVAHWDDILHIERKQDKLLLYVHAKNSDRVLYRTLQLNGSVVSVTTAEKFKAK